MRIVVCVKEYGGEIGPFDACALECALQQDGAEVIVVCMGRPSAAEVLRPLTRLGTSRVILLTDPVLAGADTLATAYALEKAIRPLGPDLVLCGRQSVDGDTAQTGAGLATLLGYPFAANVMSFVLSASGAECETRDGRVCLTLPALLTVERINTLRFPSLRSRIGEVEILTAADVGADPGRCGLKGSPTRVLKTFESSVGKRHCKFIDKSGLRDVIERESAGSRAARQIPDSPVKLLQVWCVGDELAETARRIAHSVRVIDRQPPERIADMAAAEKPEVILWPGDLWGRRNAPVVQTLLSTGLCADCTLLETDGDRLYMYRPAFGGSLTAKIECRTKPQMATVRLPGGGDDIIVAAGRGAADDIDLVRNFAVSIGAQTAASRAVVDMGLAPYEQQIGLTGRMTAAGVYIAVGISGAVQHTCALDRVGCVIAVNPDRGARIFDYADYGILGTAAEILG